MFSFRTTPLEEQEDRVLHSGRLGVFCNQTAWNPQTGCYLYENVARWGKVERIFYTGEPPVITVNDFECVPLDAGDPLSLPSEKFEDLDALIVEYQDIGSRFDPMTSLLFFLFQMLHHTGRDIAVYILDRANPDGRVVEGTVMCPDCIGADGAGEYFGVEGLPHRHGLTVGETANLLYSEIGAKFPLHIISYLVRPATQLMMPWSIPSSSDYAGLFSSFFYTGMTVVECAGYSVGRGMARPFEMVGAPYLSEWIRRRVDWNDETSPIADAAVLLRQSRFTPLRGAYAGEECFGFQLIPRPGVQYHSLAHALKILRHLKDTVEVPDLSGAEMALGDAALFGYVIGETSWDETREHLTVEEQKWVRKARRYMLYDEQLSRVRSIK